MEGLFGKGHRRGRVLKRIERKGGALGKNCPFFLLLSTETGEGAWGGAALGAGGPGVLAALRKKGKTEWEARGIDSHPHLVRRRPEAACPWRRVEVAGGCSVGGSAGRGRGRAVVEVALVVVGSSGEGYL